MAIQQLRLLIAAMVALSLLAGGCGKVESQGPDGSGETGSDDAGTDGGGDVSFFSIALSTEELTVSPGGTADLDVTVTREVAFPEPVTVVVRNLPAGVSMVPLTIYADANTGTITIRADDDALEGAFDVEVRGRVGQIDRTRPLRLLVAGTLHRQ